MNPKEWLHFVCEQLGKEWTDLPAVRQISKNHELWGVRRRFCASIHHTIRFSASDQHRDNCL